MLTVCTCIFGLLQSAYRMHFKSVVIHVYCYKKLLTGNFSVNL